MIQWWRTCLCCYVADTLGKLCVFWIDFFLHPKIRMKGSNLASFFENSAESFGPNVGPFRNLFGRKKPPFWVFPVFLAVAKCHHRLPQASGFFKSRTRDFLCEKWIDFIWFLDNGTPRWEKVKKHTVPWFCGRFLADFFFPPPSKQPTKKNTQNTKKAVILGWKKQRFEKNHMFFVFNRHGMSVASMQDVSIAASEDSWPAYLMVQWCKRWWWGQVFLLSSLNTSEENGRITISSSNLNKKKNPEVFVSLSW